MSKEKKILLVIVCVLLVSLAVFEIYRVYLNRAPKFFEYKIENSGITVKLPLNWKNEFYVNEVLENKYRFINFITKTENGEADLYRYIMTSEEHWNKDKHDDINESVIAKANGNVLAFGKYENNDLEKTALDMINDLDFIKKNSFINTDYKYRTVNIFLLPKDLSNDCTAMISSSRVIDHRVDYEMAAMEELFKGVSEAEKIEGYSSIFPDGQDIYLRGIKIENGTAYLNFKDIRNIIPSVSASCGSTAFVSQIEKTLKQFANIKKVIFAIDGSPKTFYDWIQIGCQDENICNEKPFKSINK